MTGRQVRGLCPGDVIVYSGTGLMTGLKVKLERKFGDESWKGECLNNIGEWKKGFTIVVGEEDYPFFFWELIEEGLEPQIVVAKCPRCGTEDPDLYVGFTDVECPNTSCLNYKRRRY